VSGSWQRASTGRLGRFYVLIKSPSRQKIGVATGSGYIPFCDPIFFKFGKISRIELHRPDDWQGLDECLAIKPTEIESLARYADAALRALKRMEGDELALPSFCLRH